jgi:hypothetical protein
LMLLLMGQWKKWMNTIWTFGIEWLTNIRKYFEY